MGLDIYIDKCRKPKIVNGEREYEEREEMCYWRKFGNILDIMKYDYEDYGKDVRMTKDDIENILNYVTHQRDYYGGFSSVNQVCELLDQWDELEEEGWVINFNANW